MTLALVVVLAPLAAAVLALLLGRAAAWLAAAGALISLAASLALLLGAVSVPFDTASFQWLPGLAVGLSVTPTTALLATTVASVGTFVLLYAVGYMEGEAPVRFFASMSLFLAAMQTLVVAGDWLSFLAAWELMALASYLLIGYWQQREDARAAAGRAFLTTRGADVGLYLGIFLLISSSGSTSIADSGLAGGPAAALAGLLLLVAAAGKAAQLPFQGWLSAAMAGPTPVSALLHSATLVAAGVILMVRAFPFLPPAVLLVVGVLGGLTAVVAGITALGQGDLKRLLAASTSSQLGLMLLALGSGSLAAALFHLIAHAAMKSTLFLAAGVFQHRRCSTGFRRLRGVGRESRPAYLAFAVAALALAGVPPLSGFWSKDTVIAAALGASQAWLLAPLALAGSLLTSIYLARALRLLWLDRAADGSARRTPDVAQALEASGQLHREEIEAEEMESEGEEGKSVKVNAGRWMAAGTAPLAVAAALLGLASDPLEEALAGQLPEGSLAVVLGLLVTGAGLALGWFVSSRRMLGPLLPLAESGFRFAGGLQGAFVRPVMFLARRVDRADTHVHALVEATAGSVLGLTARVASLDEGVHRQVEGVGKGSLAAARLVQASDRRWIEALISALAGGTRELGRAGRQLQSGLVHRELALTTAGVAGLLVLLAGVALFI